MSSPSEILMMFWVRFFTFAPFIIELNLISASNKDVFYLPGGEFHKIQFSTSADARYREVGQNRFLIPESWDQFMEFSKRIFSDNDLVLLRDTLYSSIKGLGSWYRSDEEVM